MSWPLGQRTRYPGSSPARSSALPPIPLPSSILVVDGDPAIRELLVEYLVTRGYRVDAVAEHRLVLGLLGIQSFDVLLADADAPEAPGLDLVQAVRQVAPDTAVLLTSGRPSVETAVAALKGGAADFLLKPFRLQRVHEAIQQALERSRVARAAAIQARTLAVHEFALGVRTPAALRLLAEDVLDLVLAETSAEAGQVLVESATRGRWRNLVAPRLDSRILSRLDRDRLAARLEDAPSAFLPEPDLVLRGAPGDDPHPGWVAAAALQSDVGCTSTRAAGAIVVAGAPGVDRPAAEILPVLDRFARLLGCAVSRIHAAGASPPVAREPEPGP